MVDGIKIYTACSFMIKNYYLNSKQNDTNIINVSVQYTSICCRHLKFQKYSFQRGQI